MSKTGSTPYGFHEGILARRGLGRSGMTGFTFAAAAHRQMPILRDRRPASRRETGLRVPGRLPRPPSLGGFHYHLLRRTAVGARSGSTSRQRSSPIKALSPRARRAAADIPETVRRFLQEATETLHAPNAAAVMAGGAVDAMLKHLGLTSVYSRINQAVSDHILTPAKGKWAHKVRLGANRPRHADTEDPFVSVPEAQQSVDFAEALVLPSRIERGIEAATRETKASGGSA